MEAWSPIALSSESPSSIDPMNIITGTAAPATMFAAALSLLQPPTLRPPLSPLGGDWNTLTALEVIRELGSSPTNVILNFMPRTVTTAGALAVANSDPAPIDQSNRETTASEHVIGELRRWSLLDKNWDGEGANAPAVESIREAAAFAGLLSDGSVVEPMLHASGRAGLYFRTATLYADVEFFGDGRAAYFVERNGDKHKGVVNFDSKQMPAVFGTLLQT